MKIRITLLAKNPFQQNIFWEHTQFRPCVPQAPPVLPAGTINALFLKNIALLCKNSIKKIASSNCHVIQKDSYALCDIYTTLCDVCEILTLCIQGQ